eukprot:998141-Prymnesium_polylepis.1
MARSRRDELRRREQACSRIVRWWQRRTPAAYSPTLYSLGLRRAAAVVIQRAQRGRRGRQTAATRGVLAPKALWLPSSQDARGGRTSLWAVLVFGS